MSGERMKILFITHLYFPAVGGAERVFQRLAEGLAGSGHDVTVLTSDALSTEQYFTQTDTSIPLRETLNGVRILRESIRIPIYRALKIFDFVAKTAGRFGVYYRPLVFGPHFTRTFREILRADFDTVIAGPTPTTALYYGLFYRLRHRASKLIMLPCFHTRDHHHTTLINRAALRSADRVLVLTDAEGAYLARRGVRSNRIRRLVVAVDEPIFQAPVSKKEGKGAGEMGGDYILYLGQEGWHKRIPLLIEAMRHLWDKGFPNPLVIAGARTDNSRTLDLLIAALPGRHKEKIFRFNDIAESRKIELLDHCRVLVNPSSFESFGIVFLEAWARHKPVIGAGIAAVREIIMDGENGLIFQDKNVRDLEDKIAILLEDLALAEKMGEAGYKEVAANYRWDAVIRSVEEVL